MPFITEELWQHLAPRKAGESLMIDPQTIPAPQADDVEILHGISIVKGIVQGVRAVRNARNIAKKEVLPLEVLKANPIPELDGIVMKMANLSAIAVVEEKGEGASSFMVGTSEYDVLLGDLVDKDAEIAKAEADLEHLRGFLASVEKKLSNERFVAHAPAAVVALEQKKKSDSEAKIKALEETLQALRK